MPIPLGRELHWLIRQARPVLRLQIVGVLCIIGSSWLYLVDPLVMKWLLDSVLPRRSLTDLFVGLLLILACSVGHLLLSASGTLLTVEASQKMVLDLRRRLLRHLDKLSSDYHDTEPVGARFYLFKEPMDEIAQLGADLLPWLLRTAVLTVSVLVAMLFLNARLTASIVPFIPIFVVVRQTYRHRLQKAADHLQDQQTTASAFLQEHFAGITQVQLLTAERCQERRAFRRFASAVRAQYRLWQTAAQFTVATNAIMAVGTIAVLGFGAREFFDGRLSVGGLVAFYAYLTRLFEPLGLAAELYSRLQRASASIRKVIGAFEIQPSVTEHPEAVAVGDEAQGDIDLDQVSFAYDGHRDVLANLTFTIGAAARIAFVGANGCGKSTIGKLLARLHDPRQGIVRLHGLDIRHMRIRNVRRMVCYLPQNAVLFTGSLRENLLFGHPAATELELASAVEIAELGPIVSKLPGGLSGFLGANGVQLSSGERQRVALARAVLRQPQVMILDEATSFIDGMTEQHILSRLFLSLPRTTFIVISHHLSAISRTAEILVLEHGSLVDRGKYFDLSQRNSLFTELFRPRSIVDPDITSTWLEEEISKSSIRTRDFEHG